MSDQNGSNGRPRRPGRPRKELSEKQIYELARIGCTNGEIATVMGVNVDTLHDNYSDVVKRGRDHMTSSLRRLQFTAARKGNIAMMIWLGKQLLGQRDQVQVDLRDIDYTQLTDEELDAIAAGKSPSGARKTQTGSKYLN